MGLSNGQWAILLEALSFFFVTLDLWGKQNLEKAHERIGGMSERFKKWAITIGFANSKLMSKTFSIFGFVIGILFSVIFVRYAVYPLMFNSDHNIGFTTAGIMFIIVALLIPIYLSGTTHAVSILFVSIFERILDAILSIFLWVLKKVKFEGVLLLIGAIAFLISKYISFKEG